MAHSDAPTKTMIIEMHRYHGKQMIDQAFFIGWMQIVLPIPVADCTPLADCVPHRPLLYLN